MKIFLKRILGNAIFRNSTWMLAGFCGRLILQFFSFILLARFLGPTSFGEFTSCLALVTLFSPFVDLGALNLIIQDISRGIPTNIAIGNSLFLSIFSLPIGFTLLILLKPLVLPSIPIKVLIFIISAEFIGNRLNQISFGAYFAHSQLWKNTIFEILSGTVKLILVIFLVKINGDINVWCFFYFLQAILFGIATICWAIYSWGRPKFNLSGIVARIKPGFHFAMGISAQTAYTDLDKTMIAKLSSLESVGIYTVASRFINVAYLPLNAFLSAIYPKFFQLGAKSFFEARKYAVKVLPFTILYGLLMTVCLFIFAPYINILMGKDYIDSSSALKILSIIPLIQGIFFPLADALSGSGKQNLRTKSQLLGLILNFCLNLIFIPIYGWRAAAYATIICQIIILLILAFYTFRDEIPHNQIVNES